jgi:hypothetical protein
MKVFPDATVVVTHRDPVSVTASLTTMVAYTARLALERVEPAAFGRYWADRVEEMLRRAVADRHLLPEDHGRPGRLGPATLGTSARTPRSGAVPFAPTQSTSECPTEPLGPG